jgi:hypothetical protein
MIAYYIVVTLSFVAAAIFFILARSAGKLADMASDRHVPLHSAYYARKERIYNLISLILFFIGICTGVAIVCICRIWLALICFCASLSIILALLAGCFLVAMANEKEGLAYVAGGSTEEIRRREKNILRKKMVMIALLVASATFMAAVILLSANMLH